MQRPMDGIKMCALVLYTFLKTDPGSIVDCTGHHGKKFAQ